MVGKKVTKDTKEQTAFNFGIFGIKANKAQDTRVLRRQRVLQTNIKGLRGISRNSKELQKNPRNS